MHELDLKSHLFAVVLRHNRACCSNPDWQHAYEKGWPDGPWYIYCASCTLQLGRGFLYEFGAIDAARIAQKLALNPPGKNLELFQ